MRFQLTTRSMTLDIEQLKSSRNFVRFGRFGIESQQQLNERR